MTVIGDTEAPQCDRLYEMCGVLRAAFRDFHVQMTDRFDFDAVGLDLTDQFKSYLEVLSAWAMLPTHQRTAIYRAYGITRKKRVDIAEELGVTDRTVRNYIADGLKAMVERIYDIPVKLAEN